MEIIYKILVNTKTNNYYLNIIFIKYITYFFLVQIIGILLKQREQAYRH